MTTDPPSSINAPIRTVAFFDFDGTLARHDSLPPFLIRTAGLRRTLFGFLRALLKPDKSQPDRKGAIKAAWLSNTLAGIPIDKARTSALRMKPKWIASTVSRLRELQQNGATIIVATGALDLYIHTLLGSLPIDHVMCTEMEVIDGIITGKMKTANCVRAEKARRVKDYLEAEAPFTLTYGFGNAPSDLPMLALLGEVKVI